MAAAIQVSPHENDMVVEMRGYAQRMVRAVAATGSGAATPDVLAFQQAWNRNLPIIKALLQKLKQPTSVAQKLVEDGQYGPKTAYALCGIICGPGLTSSPPQRASAMPVWATQNLDAINGLTPMAPAPAGTVLDAPMPIPSGGGAEEADRALQSSGSTIRDIIPVPPPEGAPPPGPAVPISTTSSYIPTGVPEPVAEVLDAPGPQNPVATEFEVGFEDDPIHIVTARPRNRVPFLAGLIGAAGLGGLMFWWVKRKKGRR